ncbi:MAG: hypothetical protein ACXVBJ_03655 [Flavisolibacter sp.]
MCIGSLRRFTSLSLKWLLVLVVVSCTKVPLISSHASSDKSIIYFGIQTYNNLGLYNGSDGLVGRDTIMFTLIDSYPLFYLFPTIRFVGKHISPSPDLAQNFSTPVIYTVTAEDGTTKNYTVIGKTIFNSNSKNITSFSFRASNNSTLTSDINGTISNDSVLVKLPAGTDLTQLTPNIMINGVSVLPASLVAQNFSQPVIYEVTAENGSFKTYTVLASN